ncbi:hypothetical protein KJ359_012548 [Pestalotiopsis sp. 9143b]|nr:hypothetical protein KJ359_012548 [Pestalotiopsis sp. 9143b]
MQLGILRLCMTNVESLRDTVPSNWDRAEFAVTLEAGVEFRVESRWLLAICETASLRPAVPALLVWTNPAGCLAKATWLL